MRKRDVSGFNTIQLFGDAVLTILGIVLAFHLRYETIQARNWEPFMQIWWVLFLGAAVLFYFFQSYHCGEQRVSDSMFAAISALLVLNFFTMAITYLTRGFAYPRSIIAISFFIQTGLLILWKNILYWIYLATFPRKTILVFGSKKANERIFFKILSGNKKYGKKIFAEDFTPKIQELITQADEVIVPMDFSKKVEIIEFCFEKKIQLSIRPTLREVTMFATELGQIDDIPILVTKSLGLNQVQRMLKRGFDIVFSLVSLILLSPIYLGVTIAIALEDGFPVIYKQERLTKDNEVFTLLKFRTMIKNAEKDCGPVLAMGADTRITKVGRILRAARLDEFPQLINVLRGEMSMVGPRPERSFFAKEIIKELPEFQYRTRVKAGITGLSQVLGKYTTTPQDKLTFDMIYIRNYSFLFDLKICFQTIRILFSKTAAKGFTHENTFEAIKQNEKYKVEEGQGYFIVNK